MEYGVYTSHPEWRELERICGQIETLKLEAGYLRERIDKEIFNKKLLKTEKGVSDTQAKS